MCVWYTGVFVRTGLLDTKGRKAFTELHPQDLDAEIDWERSRDEIPLLDSETGRMHYGIDSMLNVLGQGFPLIVRVANWRPVRLLLHYLYKVITYNRRAISGAAIPVAGLAYGPHFNVFYRSLYLTIALGFFALVLWALPWSLPVKFVLLGLGLLPVLPALLRRPRYRLHYAGIVLTPLLPLAMLWAVALAWPASLAVVGPLGAVLWLWMVIKRTPVAWRAEL